MDCVVSLGIMSSWLWIGAVVANIIVVVVVVVTAFRGGCGGSEQSLAITQDRPDYIIVY